MTAKSERKSNFELMRIVSMFMIVLWHIIIHGNLLSTTYGTSRLFYIFLLALFIVHVNSFILLTGYFQSTSKFSLKKFLKLFLLTWFYRVIIVTVLTAFNVIDIDSKTLIINILPIGSSEYWFINIYLVIYALSPFFNKLIKTLQQDEYRKLLIICFFLFSIIPFISNNATINNDGYSIIQFCYMYFLGAYFKKYPIEKNYHFKIYSKEKRQLIFIFIVLSCVGLNFISYIFSDSLQNYSNPAINLLSTYIYNNFLSYSNPIVIIQSLFYFLYFQTITLKSKFINKISSIILGVYLIHDNSFIRNILYKSLNIANVQNRGIKSIIYAFICGILIFTICITIEYIRSILTNFLENTKMVKKLKYVFYNYIEKI